MNLKNTTQKVKDLFEKADRFSDTLVFDFGPEGIISVDGGQKPPLVSNEMINSDCTVRLALKDFNLILDGALDPQMAFMSGKLSIDGNMGVAMNLSTVLKS